MLVPAGTRAKEVRPELIAADPTTGTRQRLVVHRKAANPTAAAAGGGGAAMPAWFDGVLAYPVAWADGAVAEEEDLAWELSDYEPAGGRRVRARVTRSLLCSDAHRISRPCPHPGGARDDAQGDAQRRHRLVGARDCR